MPPEEKKHTWSVSKLIVIFGGGVVASILASLLLTGTLVFGRVDQHPIAAARIEVINRDEKSFVSALEEFSTQEGFVFSRADPALAKINIRLDRKDGCFVRAISEVRPGRFQIFFYCQGNRGNWSEAWSRLIKTISERLGNEVVIETEDIDAGKG